MSPRAVLLAVLVALIALTAPMVSGAHPEGAQDSFMHLNLDVQDLGPGESVTHHLLSPEGPLRAGWIYILYGGVHGDGHVIVNLTHEETVTDRFVWTPGTFHKNSTKIQATGDHDLVLWNPTNETVRYAFYYDQSCNCVGKAIPLTGGFVLFNNKFEEGRRVHYDLFVYEEGITLKGALAAYDPARPTAHWPTDFEVLEEKTVAGKGWLNFTFVPEQTATYYVFYEAVQGASPDSPIHLTPLIEVEEEAEAPGPGMVALLTALVAVFAALRVSRR